VRTSTNNFINYCKTSKLPLTDGKQVPGGSCNCAIKGVVLAKSKLPSSKFKTPRNFETIPANQPFTISMAIQNLETGFFVNPNLNYFMQPSTINAQGVLQGHSHVVIEAIKSLQETEPLDPKIFSFFKGFNTKAVNGVLTADVINGLPRGVYRMASINTAANHAPVLAGVAQRGLMDDIIYFTAE